MKSDSPFRYPNGRSAFEPAGRPVFALWPRRLRTGEWVWLKRVERLYDGSFVRAQ